MYLLLLNIILLSHSLFKVKLDLSITNDRLTKMTIIKSDYTYILLFGLILFFDIISKGYVFCILIYCITMMIFGAPRSLFLIISSIILFSNFSYYIALAFFSILSAVSSLVLNIRRREFIKIDLF